jgi:hypothetical protein
MRGGDTPSLWLERGNDGTGISKTGHWQVLLGLSQGLLEGASVLRKRKCSDYLTIAKAKKLKRR